MDISAKIGKTFLIGLMLLVCVHPFSRPRNIEADKCDVINLEEMIPLRGCKVWDDDDRYLYAFCQMHSEVVTITETLGPRTDTIVLSWGLKSDMPVNDNLQNICLALSNITLEKNNSKDFVHTNEVAFFIARALEKEYLEIEEAYINFVIFKPRIVAIAMFTNEFDESLSLPFIGKYIDAFYQLDIRAFREPIFAESVLNQFGKIPPLSDCIAWFDAYIRHHTVPLYRIRLRTGFRRCKEALSFISHFNVTRLEFPKNSFRIINSDDFPLFKELKILNFSVGTIERIGRNAFNKLPKLIKVDLSRNRLETVPQAFYTTALPLLSELNIERNIIRSTDLFINGLSSLSKLRLSNNALCKLGDSCFSSFPQLTELYLNRCNLTLISDNSFKNLTRLVILELAHNRLLSLPENVFKPVHLLRVLNLGGNNIKAITSQQLFFLHNLEYLNFEENCLDDLISTIPSKLHHLNLRANNIYRWHSFYSPKDHSLAHLDLSSNRFTSITEDATKLLKNIAKVNLSMNPYDCSPCSLLRLRSWLKEPNAVDQNLYFCFTPVEMHNALVTEMNANPEDCFDTPLNEVVIVGACVSSVICLLLLFAGCRYFRWHIYYFVYKYRRRIFSVATIPPSSNCYRFDAFVVYAASERTWVVTELLPKMEYSNLGFNLCVHDRDFVVGEWISENIINCMSDSRKIMLLLSKNFITSQWCMFEVHLAQHKVFEKSKNCVILVKMGDLSNVYLSWYLQYLMNTRTYLEWPQLDEAKPLFWERLTRVLRRRNSPVR